MTPAERCALALSRALGDSVVRTDLGAREAVRRDESEADAVLPAAVVVVRNTNDVSTALRVCDAEGVPVVARGAGTGRTGGSVLTAPGVMLDTRAMHAIKHIDAANRTAVVEPGVVTADLHAAVEGEGLFFPPDPASAQWSVLGGNVAENAGGPRAFKYGVTREYVLGMDAVVMGGEVLRCGRRTRKGVTGYDVTGLLVGSEGTLAVFTELTVSLVPRPTELRTARVCFADVGAAADAVSRIVAGGMVPRCLELMDGICCDVMRAQGETSIREGTGAMLVIEVDGMHPGAVDAELELVMGVCGDAGATEVIPARTEAEREGLWAVRKVMSRALRATAAHKLSEDIVVPRTAVPAVLQRVTEIAAARRVTMPAYGHAGDGNLHVNFLWDDPGDRVRVDGAIEDLFRATLALGGTLSGEHGIGVMKAPYLGWEQSEGLIELQKRVKSAFDPRGLLNPGKIFPPGGRATHGGC